MLGEVGKMLGEKWKQLSEKQKAPYEAKAAADKKRYEEEKAAYTAVSILAHLSLTSLTECRVAPVTMTPTSSAR